MDDLEKNGLILVQPHIALTEKGAKYLEEYQKVREFMERFGLVRAGKPRGS